MSVPEPTFRPIFRYIHVLSPLRLYRRTLRVRLDLRSVCRSLCLGLATAFVLTAPQPAWAAENHLTDMEVINVAPAYAAGYTGAGQTVGVVDQPVRVDHPALAGKADMLPVTVGGQVAGIDWHKKMHGSHVAGIIAANEPGAPMRGVAYEAGIWAGSDLLEGQDDLDWAAWFAAHPEVRIVNNSWGSPDVDHQQYASSGGLAKIENLLAWLPSYNQAIYHAQDHPETVLVFATGNSGQMEPAPEAAMPYYLGQDLPQISVSALNSRGITRENGSFVLSPASVPWFSNLFTNAELFSVMAPGTSILSLNAGTLGYTTMTGTSMAAPVVSGALALVA